MSLEYGLTCCLKPSLISSQVCLKLRMRFDLLLLLLLACDWLSALGAGLCLCQSVPVLGWASPFGCNDVTNQFWLSAAQMVVFSPIYSVEDSHKYY